MTVAVWVGYPNSGKPMLKNFDGGPVEGGTFPAIIWHNFMVQALQIMADESAAKNHTTAPTSTPERRRLATAPRSPRHDRRHRRTTTTASTPGPTRPRQATPRRSSPARSRERRRSRPVEHAARRPTPQDAVDRRRYAGRDDDPSSDDHPRHSHHRHQHQRRRRSLARWQQEPPSS